MHLGTATVGINVGGGLPCCVRHVQLLSSFRLTELPPGQPQLSFVCFIAFVR